MIPSERQTIVGLLAVGVSAAVGALVLPTLFDRNVLHVIVGADLLGGFFGGGVVLTLIRRSGRPAHPVAGTLLLTLPPGTVAMVYTFWFEARTDRPLLDTLLLLAAGGAGVVLLATVYGALRSLRRVMTET